jgi:hypothetical protein
MLNKVYCLYDRDRSVASYDFDSRRNTHSGNTLLAVK